MPLCWICSRKRMILARWSAGSWAIWASVSCKTCIKSWAFSWSVRDRGEPVERLAAACSCCTDGEPMEKFIDVKWGWNGGGGTMGKVGWGTSDGAVGKLGLGTVNVGGKPATRFGGAGEELFIRLITGISGRLCNMFAASLGVIRPMMTNDCSMA